MRRGARGTQGTQERERARHGAGRRVDGGARDAPRQRRDAGERRRRLAGQHARRREERREELRRLGDARAREERELLADGVAAARRRVEDRGLARRDELCVDRVPPWRLVVVFRVRAAEDRGR